MPLVKPLAGKTVLVTGGARRLGRALALAAADAGATVAVTYLDSADEARKLVQRIEQKGGQSLAIRCDVRQEKSIVRAVGVVVRKLGQLDVLINNAGTFAEARFEELTAEQWDDMFSTNVRGPFLMSKHCLPALRATRGRIIHLGSLGGAKPWATHAHYNC